MTERPILFQAPMVRAILDGRKTQTRRVLSQRNVTVLGERWGAKSPWSGLRFNEAWPRACGPLAHDDPNLAVPFCHPDDEPMATEDCGIYRVRPVVEVGDSLWVRETWKPHSVYSGMRPRDIPETPIFYRADERYAPSNTPWKPGIHMPRWASRITLEVTAVKVERLQDISAADAQAEGVSIIGVGADVEVYRREAERNYEAARRWNAYRVRQFRALWDSINGKCQGCSWDTNPWVIAITFQRVKP